LVGLGMYLQIFPIDLTVADRWFYFPIIGLLGIIGIGIISIKHISNNLKMVLCGIVLIIIIFLSIRTMVRNTNWYDAITLYNHDIKIEDNFDIENNLGGEYSFLLDNKKALEYFQKSAELFPNESNLCNIGNTYGNLGDLQKAKDYCIKAFKSKNYLPITQKHNLFTYDTLAKIYIYLKEPINAKKIIKEGLLEYPNSGELYKDLALAEYELQNQKDALSAIEEAKKFISSNEIDVISTQISNNLPIKIQLGNNNVIEIP
jgi:tetratricopeptide (TPR) repeat protein